MIGLMVYDYGLVLNLAALPSGQLIARALALSLVVVVVALLRLHFGREESVSLARSLLRMQICLARSHSNR